MKTVLNIGNPRNWTNKLYFGEKLGISNFADMKYPIFKRLYKDQLSFIWFPDEISMSRDASDYEGLSDTERFIFEANLSFQTLGDSFLGKGIDGILEHVTNNELYQSLKVHSFFEESIHTPSYSHIIENVYNDPAERFYQILQNPEILKRAEQSTERFNSLLNSDGISKKADVVNTIIGLLALESISFYNSFLTSFYFAKNGKMTGTGSLIKLIARDENLHKANGINQLKIFMTRKDEGFYDMRDEIRDKILLSFKEMALQEIDWVDYILANELPGLTKQGAVRYIKHLTNRAVLDVGLTKNDYIFEDVENPYQWVNSFLGSSKSTQVAPQEKEVTSYVKGSKNDLAGMTF